MPEGDSLVRVANRLRPVLAGQSLLRTDFRVPQLATADLSGSTVGAVWPRAKYLVIETGERAVLSHLKMEGHWDVYSRTGPDGGPVRPRWRSPGWQARCVLETAGDQVVGFQLGLLEVLPTASVAERLAFLGPDLLDPAWDDPADAARLLRESVARLQADPQRPIGLALLDQRLVSGIGNIYRCETLLLAGLHPHRPVGAVPDLPGLVLLARDLMRVNTGPGPRGTTGVLPDGDAAYGVRVRPAPEGRRAGGRRDAGGARFTPGGVPVDGDPRGRAGAASTASAAGAAVAAGAGLPTRRQPNYWVYGRERKGCLRCGGPVVVEQFGDLESGTPERVLFWCPHCQR
ncbi:MULTISPECIES: DNA-formamidopyrimidine glycosylase family protein [Micrococcaceae]|uniref:DNA-formamidopyrimidine glycosylase family protein n=1 Tax=Micrococcaceae TaxID=1268 RepID=UPI0016222D35|nr:MULTISPECIES: DNA-formamidopyrimidine glycosylase family protein [Micrococcaceae]MBB5747721.1 endonuclease-8 [Micrococcus sp. TA1]HRO30361.1 DNA-formamidopyrimidine glycosylase family protein [Citricoccus sp.]HRO93368.1 DNA-formamidopyrimidine glycosylase family protein [Citricoccus sp.]